MNQMAKDTVEDAVEMNFSTAELQRYSRQINLSQVGKEGQRRLKEARVLCGEIKRCWRTQPAGSDAQYPRFVQRRSAPIERSAGIVHRSRRAGFASIALSRRRRHRNSRN